MWEVWEFSNAHEYRMRGGVVSIIAGLTLVDAKPWLDQIEARGHYWQVRRA